jgi:gamma-glutamyltranspeptidase/glutathione hydrolase
MVSSGHHLASLAGINILKKGGNAIDAGVAMGLCINVLQPEYTNFGGVAPIMLYSANEDEVISISGLGTWPENISIEAILERGGELSQDQFISSVVPSAPDAWITALDSYGTMSFSEVSESAIKLAEYGFPAYPFLINNLIRRMESLQKYEYTKSVFYPSGKIPRIGDLIIQRDLARLLKRLVRIEEKNRHLGRHNALMYTRDEFYMGEIAKELVGFLQEKGGFLTLQDMANFKVRMEKPVKTMYRDIEVYCCGPWCQGPVNALALNILEGYDLVSLGHNSAEYLHVMISSLDLAFADREKYFGDPEFVDVPINELASKEYAETRRSLIDPSRTWGKMPPPGDPRNFKAISLDWKDPGPGAESHFPDTSYGCVIDKEGNAFSATPSDGGRLVPGLGIGISPRGAQSWLDPNHSSSVAPGKRPRLTPNPALAMKDGEVFMAYGTPGNDSQPQTMVQVLVNIVDFKMNVQQAIEAPRFRSANFPASSWPHEYLPGRVSVEGRVPSGVLGKLRGLGYDLKVFPDYTYECGGISVVLVDKERGLLMGGADPRRENYAIGF